MFVAGRERLTFERPCLCANQRAENKLMKLADSPLRILVKSYANGILDRQQYLKIREHLLKKLALNGTISEEDLENFLKLYRDTEEPVTSKGYSAADWFIIVLGLSAALALGFILYS